MSDLEDRYLALVRDELPAAARRDGWVIRNDHCFGRVLLDDAVGGCWYDVLGRGRGAAFRRLEPEQLSHAVAQGERMLREGADTVAALDAQSLAWRGRAPKRAQGA